MIQKWIATLILSILIFFAIPMASAQPRSHGPFGLGIVLGEPTAITAKYWADRERAFDFGTNFWLSRYFMFYADHLWHFPSLFRPSSKFSSQLLPYIGVGGITWIVYDERDGPYWKDRSAKFGLGVRVPFGIEWNPGSPPLGIFLEIAPGVSIIPGTYGFFNAGIGIRYFF